MSIREKLTIKNFFTITEFEWDIKGFNVLTGGMASGKSLALKLLFFCEQVFQKTIFEATINKELFQKEVFFKKLSENFDSIFVSKDRKSDYKNTKIVYMYEILPKSEPSLFDAGNSKFDLLAEFDTESNRLHWSSNYIASKLKTWQPFFDEQNTPELMERIRKRVYESIMSDFSNAFPLAAIFIPASRAIAAITSNIKSRDQFIDGFMSLKEFVLSFNDISSESVNQILQFKNISIENDKNKQPVFELINGREISSIELSSGQQELLYLLLLIDDLKRTGFDYGYYASIFIEEPSAHLFPKEQKDTIEFLSASFNGLQKDRDSALGHRFFISTHSPYVLNTINNLLEKGRLLKMIEHIDNIEEKQKTMEKIKALRFPSLNIEDVSAYMIEQNGSITSMIHNEDNEPYMYSEVIDKISQEITSGTEKLFDLDNEIKSIMYAKAKKVEQ